ncbi:hypothetical protein [uncultured Dokdonia sp.]|uniref:nuclear transport factor 2 family protein n=1 Tax=uncultured Dokdonia sp. TaxID=575653 RepID=UPI0026074F19|nr:hypothetical protein [uncultured Dokdonia sp.]
MKNKLLIFIVSIGVSLCSCDNQNRYIKQSKRKENIKKEHVTTLLNTLQTGKTESLNTIVNSDKYIQHNLMAADGLEGLKSFISILPRESTKVEIKRIFQDKDYVFTHVQYDIFGPKIGFDVFRFENYKIVEHWDNLQNIAPLNPSGHSMIDGTTKLKRFR